MSDEWHPTPERQRRERESIVLCLIVNPLPGLTAAGDDTPHDFPSDEVKEWDNPSTGLA